MGDLITNASYSEITKLVEILDHQDVTPRDLEILRKASSWSQSIVGRIHRTDSFLWALLGIEGSLAKSGFCENDFRRLGADEDKLQKVLAIIREGQQPTILEKPALAVSDNIIRPNRIVTQDFPDWVDKVLHPELQKTGPVEYDVTKLEQWLHNGQKNGKWIKGQVIYEYLKDKKMLESCINLADLLAIQTKGIDFFRQHFAGKVVFAWKSVVQHRDGRLYVPYLCDGGRGVVLRWHWLEDDWDGRSPALRLAS